MARKLIRQLELDADRVQPWGDTREHQRAVGLRGGEQQRWEPVHQRACGHGDASDAITKVSGMLVDP
jgi:hypothetical protein